VSNQTASRKHSTYCTTHNERPAVCNSNTQYWYVANEHTIAYHVFKYYQRGSTEDKDFFFISSREFWKLYCLRNINSSVSLSMIPRGILNFGFQEQYRIQQIVKKHATSTYDYCGTVLTWSGTPPNRIINPLANFASDVTQEDFMCVCMC